MFGKSFLAAAVSLAVFIGGALGFSAAPQAGAHGSRHGFQQGFPAGLVTATECLALRAGAPLAGVRIGQCLKTAHASAPTSRRPESNPRFEPNILQLSGGESATITH